MHTSVEEGQPVCADSMQTDDLMAPEYDLKHSFCIGFRLTKDFGFRGKTYLFRTVYLRTSTTYGCPNVFLSGPLDG